MAEIGNVTFRVDAVIADEQYHEAMSAVSAANEYIAALEADNARLRVERDEWRRVAVSKQDIIDHMRDANAENAALRKETDTLTRRIDELCMEVERLRNQHTAKARRIVVSNKQTDHATGHTECSACGGAIDYWDAWCRHCGASLEDTDG